MNTAVPPLPGDGLVAYVKRACPTCAMIAGEMVQVADARADFRIVSQDDPHFPAQRSAVLDDRELDLSYLADIEATPTLIRYAKGTEVVRVVGWDKAGWRRLTGLPDLGATLPALQPG